MIRSQGNSKGVLGPVGLLLIGVLWIMTVSGSFTAGRSPLPAAPDAGITTDSEKDHIEHGPLPTPGPLQTGLTATPTSLPATGTGA